MTEGRLIILLRCSNGRRSCTTRKDFTETGFCVVETAIAMNQLADAYTVVERDNTAQAAKAPKHRGRPRGSVMGLQLPDDLIEALSWVGCTWPEADESILLDCGSAWLADAPHAEHLRRYERRGGEGPMDLSGRSLRALGLRGQKHAG